MPSDWWNELKRPGTLIGIAAGIIIAFGTWFFTRQTTELSFQITQVPVFNAAEAGATPAPFSVLDSAGKRIERNIYAANLVLWNSGDVELGGEKIRRPVTIDFDGPVKILDQSISRITDPVSEASASYVGPDTVTIRWRYFDPGTGLRVRIIYISDKERKLKLSANILGIHDLYDTDAARKSWTKAVNLLPLVAGLGFFLTMLLIAVIGRIGNRLDQQRAALWRIRAVVGGGLLSVLVSVLLTLWWIWSTIIRPVHPPI